MMRPPLFNRTHVLFPDMCPIDATQKLVPKDYLHTVRRTVVEISTSKGRFIAFDDPAVVARHEIFRDANVPVLAHVTYGSVELFDVPAGARPFSHLLTDLDRSAELCADGFFGLGSAIGHIARINASERATPDVSAIPILGQFAVTGLFDTIPSPQVHASMPYILPGMLRELRERVEQEVQEQADLFPVRSLSGGQSFDDHMAMRALRRGIDRTLDDLG